MTQEEREFALSLVKDSLKAYLKDRTYLSPPKELLKIFSKNGASFVTLNRKDDKSLRGCMGTIVSYRSLAQDLIHNAISSATGDPRFAPLTLEELDSVSVEVSVLTEPKPLQFTNTQDLLEKIRRKRDGVIIKRGEHQATFLPSVWEQIDDKEEFFRHLCHKAGMELECFKDPSLEVFIYETIKIKEEL